MLREEWSYGLFQVSHQGLTEEEQDLPGGGGWKKSQENFEQMN